ncbi:DUF7684 family protein [Novosphingobium sp.]|jgi:hypothetical protein|uniref:DUF7684 family protein n=1 Tax=Novosphingobium sp. TaxID=1874826 RepID=UPI002FE18156
MALRVLHLSPNHSLPSVEPRPYRVVLIAERAVAQVWRDEVASWLVDRGCLYFIAWGVACEDWHDAVDWTVLEAFDFGEIPDDRFVMTTWHSKETLPEALWFAENCATHPNVDLTDTLIVHVTYDEKRAATLQLYSQSQLTADET